MAVLVLEEEVITSLVQNKNQLIVRILQPKFANKWNRNLLFFMFGILLQKGQGVGCRESVGTKEVFLRGQGLANSECKIDEAYFITTMPFLPSDLLEEINSYPEVVNTTPKVFHQNGVAEKVS